MMFKIDGGVHHLPFYAWTNFKVKIRSQRLRSHRLTSSKLNLPVTVSRQVY